MKPCVKLCFKNNATCREKTCRMWLDYEEDLNCANIAIARHGKMTLKEVGKRLNLSYVRITQIEKDVIKKLKK